MLLKWCHREVVHMCCDKLRDELKYRKRFEKDEFGLYLSFKEHDYDEDYGHSFFTQKLIIKYCPFCGTSH